MQSLGSKVQTQSQVFALHVLQTALVAMEDYVRSASKDILLVQDYVLPAVLHVQIVKRLNQLALRVYHRWLSRVHQLVFCAPSLA
jgi:hypothetical protein